MNLQRVLAFLFFAGYLFVVFVPLNVPVWIPVTILAILYFLIIEWENVSYYLSLTSIAFVVQLSGGLSSPLFVSYLPVIFILKKRGLKLKFWWLILPLFSLLRELSVVPYLIFYGAVVFLYFLQPKIHKKESITTSKSADDGEKVDIREGLSEKKEIPSTISNKIYDSLSASVDIIIRMFNPFSVVLLVEKEQPDEFQVRIAKSEGEIKPLVTINKGPLSWFLKNQGILVNNDFKDSSMNLGYYKNENNITCFMASSIRFNEEVVGIIVVDRTEKKPFDERDKELLSSVVKGLSTLFSLYKHMNVSMLEAFRFRSLLSLTGKVAGEIKLEEVRKSIFETVKNCYRDVWTIFLLKEGNEYHVTEEDGRRYYQHLRKSIIALALEKNISLCKADLSNETKRPILFPEERTFEAKSLLFSPFRGDVKGGILLLSKHIDWFDRNNDLMILNMITDIAASSVEKAVLYDYERQKAIRDGLTETYNHRFFQEMLDNKIAEAQRNNEPISLLMIDLDNFKLINDQFGHQNGDMILREVGRLMKERIRASDILARYGGEEFAIILPKTAAPEGYKLAENLRDTIEDKTFISPDDIKFKITVSIGVSELGKHAHNKPDLIAAADRGLYNAKKGGKNRTEIAED
jgi:diguanylate cyclase (GGDEF)-like protein